ncbi:hypothetical protein ACHQM5_029229 [Ranunculus cassubicifolius]
MSMLPIPENYRAPLDSQGERWRNFYRSAVKGTGNRYRAKCGFCWTEVDGRTEKLYKHVVECDRWPGDEKAAYMQDAVIEKSKSARKRRLGEEELMSLPTPSASSKKKKTMQLFVSPSSTKKQGIRSVVVKPGTNEIHALLLKAIIYGGISFTIGDNIFFKQFVQGLSSSYSLPSSETLKGHLLAEMYSNHLQKKYAVLPSFVDFTIVFDGWIDNSGNSIYAFILQKEDSEHVLDIFDLSEVRYTMQELKEIMLSDLITNRAVVDNVLAFVTNTPGPMVRLRNEIKAGRPNVISVNCCLHAFNTLAKDVLGFVEAVKVVQLNQMLVNYFTSSQSWRKELKKWQAERNLLHSLSNYCETRWYSVSLVCVGVATYAEGFRHCVELSKTPGYAQVNPDIAAIIMDHHHFAKNACLVEALKPIIDVIAKLDRRTTTLADVFLSFITVYENAKTAHYSIQGLRDHILCATRKIVKDYEDPIYFVALFLHPACKNLAMSQKMTGEKIIREALEIAKVWRFTKNEAGLLFKELINYKNGDAPFSDLNERSGRSARDFWEKFYGASPMLRRFAKKLFAILPHSGSCERLFSTLGLINSKTSSNRLELERLNMVSQIKCDLANEVRTKKISGEGIIDGFLTSDVDDRLHDLIEVVQFDNDLYASSIMENFFNLDAFEPDIVYDTSANNLDINCATSKQDDGDWSIDDVIQELS